MPRASKRASDTRAPADTNAPVATEAEYQAAVAEGIAIVKSISGKQWALGDQAAKVEKVYGENRLERYAEDINFPGAVCTLRRYRDVCHAFPKKRGRPRFFASAQVLATHPAKFEIVERNPDIGKQQAREIMREWRAEHASTATPTGADAEQPENEDLIEPEEDTEPTPGATSTPAKAAKAKGPKKTDSKEQAQLKENKRWFNSLVDLANGAIGAAEVMRCTPDQRARLTPECVEEQTANYFYTQDSFSKWQEQCCVEGKDKKASSAALWRSWQLWAKEHDVSVGDETAFAESLRERGFLYVKNLPGSDGKYHRGWRGLEVAKEVPPDEPEIPF